MATSIEILSDRLRSAFGGPLDDLEEDAREWAEELLRRWYEWAYRVRGWTPRY